MAESKYWAASPADEIGDEIKSKVASAGTASLSRNVTDRYSRAYQYYFGIDPSGVHATSQILRAGEQGELAAIRVNHTRALVNTLLNLIVGPKLIWQPKATNADAESLRECDLAAAVLEYYWREKHVSGYAQRAVEEALVFSEGFVLAEWNPDAGEDAGVVVPEDEAAPPIDPAAPPAPAASLWDKAKTAKSGDLEFINVSSWQVVRDSHATSWERCKWAIVQDWANRFDLAAEYPEKAEEILNAPNAVERESGTRSPDVWAKEETDDIPILKLFHRPTSALPGGRYVLALADGTVLEDKSELKRWPLVRVSAGELIGSPYGYTSFWDILGIQELMDSLNTAVASNQSTFAGQLVAMEMGSEVPLDDLAGGMKGIYYPQGGKPPEAVNLTKSPPEVFAYLDSLKKQQELVLGLNSVVRGETPSGEMSGSALALLQSQALQQSSVVQSNYVRMVEALGSLVIDLISDHADYPQKLAIAGKASAILMPEEEISKESFKRIRRVHVEIGNPLAQTPAGRSEMAKDLMTLGLVRTPEQYIEVLSSGRLEPLTQGLHHELLLIRSENEQMVNGESPPVAALDNHKLHAQEHKCVLANPQVRKDAVKMRNILMHIQEHLVQFQVTDPFLLDLVGIAPPMPMLGPDGMPVGGPGPAGGPPGGPEGVPPGPQGLEQPNGGNPNAGSPPAEMPNPPMNPATGLDWNPVDGGGVAPR